MKVLALELSAPVGSVAFCDGSAMRDFRTFPADRKDSGFFYENLRAVYQNHGPPDLIAVGLGPGSYAGVRIALATAIGLGAAAGARLRGLPSICAFCREQYLFVGDARRNSYVFAHVIDGRCIAGPELANEDETRARLQEAADVPIIATQPLPLFEKVIVEQPSALRLVELASRTSDDPEAALEPIYLRPPYITTPQK